jgi:Right handed beta helix region
MYVAPSRRRAELHPDAREAVGAGGVALEERDLDDHADGDSPPPAIPEAGDDAGDGASPFRRGRGSGEGRSWRKLILNTAAVVALLMTGAVLLQDDGPADAGIAPGTELTETGKLTITKDNTVIDARDISGPIYIKANNVTIRNSRVTYGGDYLIRIYAGFKNATIEDTELVCPKDTKGSAIAFGRYVADGVDVTGCKNAFLTTGGDVKVTNSLWNGEKVEISVGRHSGAQPMPTTTVATAMPPAAGETPLPTTTAPPRPTTTAPAALPSGTPADSSGFPDSSTTGVKPGVNLAPSGSITVTEPGKVLENLHITGTVTIEADNVTIRNTLIDNTSTYPIRHTNGNKNLLVEDVEINGNGQGNVAVYGGSYTLRRVDIHHTLDGPRIEGNDVLIEDSYVHHLHRIPDGHHDTIQIRRGINVTIRGNNLQPYNPDTNDPMNAAIQVGSLNGPTGEVLVENNLMNGGNYTVNASKSEGNTFTFRNNTFGTNARYGIYSDGPGVTWVGNIMQGTGAPAT